MMDSEGAMSALPDLPPPEPETRTQPPGAALMLAADLARIFTEDPNAKVTVRVIEPPQKTRKTTPRATTPRPGRPATTDAARVIALREDPQRYTWRQIAEMMGVSQGTAIRVYRKSKGLRVERPRYILGVLPRQERPRGDFNA